MRLTRKIKYAWQRVTRGYDDTATWNINDWFLELMPKMLDQMIKEHYGHPFELTSEEWEQILVTMRDCFLEANEDTCSMKNKYEDDWLKMHAEFAKQYGEFGEKLLLKPEEKNSGSVRLITPDNKEVGNLEWQKLSKKHFEEEKKISNYRDKKLKEGLKLFSKYFWNLWD